jgi:hypothetical protein
VDRIGGEHHVSELFDGAAYLVAHFVELVGLREFAEQMRHIVGDVGIVESELALVAVADHLVKEGFKWMRLG